MPSFAANLTYLFKELPFLDRFQAAADAGFQGVEVLFPYEDAATEILARLSESGLPLVLINMPPPNYAGGPRGFAAVPGGEARFRRDFRRALRYAARLKVRHIHIMAGKAEGLAALDCYLRNLAWAAAEAPEQSLTIEPLNAIDMPGYFLADFEMAAELLTKVGAPNLGLQFDTYHAQMIGGDAVALWDRFGPFARHVQVGSVPGRHEPVGGDLDFPAFFRRLDAEGYAGYVGAEYTPRGHTLDGLGWLRERVEP